MLKSFDCYVNLTICHFMPIVTMDSSLVWYWHDMMEDVTGEGWCNKLTFDIVIMVLIIGHRTFLLLVYFQLWIIWCRTFGAIFANWDKNMRLENISRGQIGGSSEDFPAIFVMKVSRSGTFYSIIWSPLMKTTSKIVENVNWEVIFI